MPITPDDEHAEAKRIADRIGETQEPPEPPDRRPLYAKTIWPSGFVSHAFNFTTHQLSRILAGLVATAIGSIATGAVLLAKMEVKQLSVSANAPIIEALSKKFEQEIGDLRRDMKEGDAKLDSDRRAEHAETMTELHEIRSAILRQAVAKPQPSVTPGAVASVATADAPCGEANPILPDPGPHLAAAERAAFFVCLGLLAGAMIRLRDEKKHVKGHT